jgi:hypothetical protein
VTICRKSTDGKLSKAAEQEPANVQMTPSMAVVSTPPQLVGASFTACSNVDARSSAQQIVWYLESLKDVEGDWKVSNSLSLLQDAHNFAHLFIFVYFAQ